MATQEATPTHVSTTLPVSEESIELRKVETHNLRGIDCTIPHRRFTVISGVSGSGKSSLAFDTLYAEGQRRYTESLSTYARQFLQRLERPPVESVRNIQPAVALRQHNEVQNARSTVGTVTEINDHLELLYTHIGRTICPTCGEEVRRDTVTSALEGLLSFPEGSRFVIVAEVQAEHKEHRPAILKQLVQEGYRRLYVSGETVDIDSDALESLLDLDVLPVVIDRVAVRSEDKMRLSEAIETGFAIGKGRLLLYEHESEAEPVVYDRAFRCNTCSRDFTVPQPALFSFNSSLGACPVCSGFGRTVGLDFKKVIPNDMVSLEGGAIAPLETPKYKSYKTKLLRACRAQNIPVNLSWRKLPREQQKFVRDGGKGWEGVRGFFEKLRSKQYKTHVRILLARYRGYDTCHACEGGRLGADARAVRVAGRPISDIWGLRIEEARVLFEELDLTQAERQAGKVLLDEIHHRLAYLETVGLGYLTLDRQSRTLSGGEMQRIHLTANLGRALTDTLYVLDEPTAGLHAVDSQRLLMVLQRLRDLGNTVVVVEHDPEIIEGADHVIELGPHGGEQGGQLMFSGEMESFRQADTITSRSLRERLTLPAPKDEELELGACFEIVGAREHNLEDLHVRFPLEKMTAVTGVSGSGKSTLLHTVLYNGWRRLRGQGGIEAGAVDEFRGLEAFEDVVMMDQSAIGRSSRSNSLSYTKAYDDIRKLFARTDHAKRVGLKMGDFSFNTPGGRCEHCQGVGTITIEMHFMADIEITCPECQGKRFTEKVLGVEVRDRSIHDILEMTVDEAMEFFSDSKPILRKIKPLVEVGLGYIRMGQPTTTLSGGEAQRLKLATYIAQGRKRGETDPVLFIFDEPTVGLHLEDVKVLLSALRKLIEVGHTVVVIEHNIDFVAHCDWVVDLGPGAGPRGGRLVTAGPPSVVARCEESVTGTFLQEIFQEDSEGG